MPAENIQRVTLPANQVTAVLPPINAHGVVIGNATAGELRRTHQKTDLAQYEACGAGFTLTVTAYDGAHKFVQGQVAFYLIALAGGPVSLRWI